MRLAKAARLVSKRAILDKEFALKDENKVVEDIVAGRVGISYGEWWYPNWPLNIEQGQRSECGVGSLSHSIAGRSARENRW
jgi:hypothetical protein